MPPILDPRSPVGSWASSTVLSSRTHGVTSVPWRGCERMASKGRVISQSSQWMVFPTSKE